MRKKFFAFSFGGKNDFGKVLHEDDFIDIDFPKDDEIGYGLAIRNVIDCHIPKQGKYKFNLHTNHPINLTVEIKTQLSGGAPEFSKTFHIEDGFNTISARIPENLSSELKEIVIFVPKVDNPGLKTSLILSSYEFN